MKNDRHSNDKSSYVRKLNEVDHTYDYIMDTNKYQNNKEARHIFGLLGGNIVNNSYKDIIDMESKLLGIDNKLEYCVKNNKKINKNDIKYLQPFQMLRYEEIRIKE